MHSYQQNQDCSRYHYNLHTNNISKMRNMCNMYTKSTRHSLSEIYRPCHGIFADIDFDNFSGERKKNFLKKRIKKKIISIPIIYTKHIIGLTG